MESGESSVLMALFTESNKLCRVYFRGDAIVWKERATPSETFTICLRDMISVSIGSKPKRISPKLDKNSRTVRLDENTSSSFLNLNYVCTENRKMTIQSKSFYTDNKIQLNIWYQSLKSALAKEKRPKKVLVFVNPYSGRKTAEVTFKNTVVPIFKLVGMDFEVVVTRSSGHLIEYIHTVDLNNFDGVIGCGGDGTIAEICNALVIRTIRDAEIEYENIYNEPILPKPVIPVGVIPCGSTDCMAYTLHGTSDPTTAALMIVLGMTHGVDGCAVFSEKKLYRFFFSLFAYGFLGDMLLDSENYRWLGSKRYDYSGACKAFVGRNYKCEISMILSNQSAYNGPKCRQTCEVCSRFRRFSKGNQSKLESTGSVPKLKKPERKGEKVVKKDQYFMVACANISCSCKRSPNGLAPNCHLGDGAMDIILLKPSNIIQVATIVKRSRSKTASLLNLPYVEAYRVVEWSLTALNENYEQQTVQDIEGRCLGASVWNCDGELFTGSNVHVRNYRQLIQMFTRRFGTIYDDDTNENCCRNCFKKKERKITLDLDQLILDSEII